MKIIDEQPHLCNCLVNFVELNVLIRTPQRGIPHVKTAFIIHYTLDMPVKLLVPQMLKYCDNIVFARVMVGIGVKSLWARFMINAFI